MSLLVLYVLIVSTLFSLAAVVVLAGKVVQDFRAARARARDEQARLVAQKLLGPKPPKPGVYPGTTGFWVGSGKPLRPFQQGPRTP